MFWKPLFSKKCSTKPEEIVHVSYRIKVYLLIQTICSNPVEILIPIDSSFIPMGNSKDLRKLFFWLENLFSRKILFSKGKFLPDAQ